MIERLSELVNVDEALVRRGRFLTCDFLVEVGEMPYHVSVERGRIASVTRGPVLMRPWRFAIRAPEDAWRDLQPLMANLRYIKEVLEAPRRLARSA